MKNNMDINHKPKYKKCGIKYDIGIGILTKNPSQVNKNDFLYYKPVQWIWYDGYWYLTKERVTPNKIEDGCYCEEHVINKLINLII